MSFAFRLYSLLLPQAIKKHTDPLQKHYHDWRKSRKLLKRKRQLSSPKACLARRERLRNILKERPLKVAFQVAQLAKWKSESVFQLMQRDAHFSPFIWCVPVADQHRTAPDLYEQEQGRIISYFEQKGITVYLHISLNDFPVEERPDLIFIYEPYDSLFNSESFRGLTQELLCYVPYCFHNTNSSYYDAIGNNCAVFEFAENDFFGSYLCRHATHQGRNSVVTGTPLADIFMAEDARSTPVWKDCGKPMKKVIWAPHWSVKPGLSRFVCSTFLKNAEAMTELAEQYQETIQFAFKPHPNLYRVLCELPEWGKEKTDAFYRRWQEMPNTQLEEGAYTALFMQSDAMLHDSGSFILEYLFADKPCMFLRDGDGYGDYNKQSIDCLRAYQFGLHKEDIDLFLQRCVLGTEDPLRELRAEMRERYLLPPHGVPAAQNIIDAILHV